MFATFYLLLQRLFANYGVIVLLLLVQISMSLMDMHDDIRQHLPWEHLTNNLALSLLSFFSIVLLAWRLRSKEADIAQLTQEIGEIKQTLGQQTQQAARLMGELSQIIHQQFSDWKLTDAEKEVALLLLKGLSLEEIAQTRGRAEKTVRQQASAIYTKTGLAGRHALSAYFFEDLLRN